MNTLTILLVLLGFSVLLPGLVMVLVVFLTRHTITRAKEIHTQSTGHQRFEIRDLSPVPARSGLRLLSPEPWSIWICRECGDLIGYTQRHHPWGSHG